MVCVDLDGTLAKSIGVKHGTGEIGPVNEPVAEVVRQMFRAGYYICVFSCRTWSELNPVVLWCVRNGVPVNDYFLASKPPAILFIDDRSVNPHTKNWKLEISRILRYAKKTKVRKVK